MWREDGMVQIDGKLVASEDVQTYREQGTNRSRARTRGGRLVRAKESRQNSKRLFETCCLVW